MKKMLIRNFEIQNIQRRDATDDGKEEVVLGGYASVFNERTTLWEGFDEVIAPGAFSRALSENQDIRCLFNHNWENILGRTKAGTLILEEDERGLKFEVKLPDTTVARDLAKSIERGDVNQCSFGFIPTEEIDYKSDPVLRTIKEVDLYEVSIVTIPQYESTEVSLVRSKEDVDEYRSLIEKRKKILNEIEEMLKHE
ncbi:HK97 family phage prohead protease [Enterococcus cecorum]|uniref:HK97 family phage prohead protease n=1 Tax=Enterococcus cecorum TaxID=44008 RepID=UPI00148BF653|nr:HK97 family phage prohead protease [Enterococcus cecorum]